jgi:hypothetical protein
VLCRDVADVCDEHRAVTFEIVRHEKAEESDARQTGECIECEISSRTIASEEIHRKEVLSGKQRFQEPKTVKVKELLELLIRGIFFLKHLSLL